jgi:hypothetical protein
MQCVQALAPLTAQDPRQFQRSSAPRMHAAMSITSPMAILANMPLPMRLICRCLCSQRQKGRCHARLGSHSARLDCRRQGKESGPKHFRLPCRAKVKPERGDDRGGEGLHFVGLKQRNGSQPKSGLR